MHMFLRRVDSEALVAGQIWAMRIPWSAAHKAWGAIKLRRGTLGSGVFILWGIDMNVADGRTIAALVVLCGTSSALAEAVPVWTSWVDRGETVISFQAPEPTTSCSRWHATCRMGVGGFGRVAMQSELRPANRRWSPSAVQEGKCPFAGRPS